MRVCPVCFFLLATVATLSGADLAFLDGREWKEVRILSRGDFDVVVMYEDEMHTVHAVEVTAACAQELGIRVQTEAEKVRRAADEERRQREHQEKGKAETEAEMEAWRLTAENQATQAAKPSAPTRVDIEPVQIIGSQHEGLETHLQGTVVARIEGGALVRGLGRPSRSRVGSRWILGVVFIHNDNRLIATTGGAPILGKVMRAGEFRLDQGNGLIRTYSAWRLY